MDWSRLTRLWAYPWRNRSAQHRWEYIGRSFRDAARMMDGSTGEEDLRRRGAHVAELLAGVLEIAASHRVLEVGCGVGRVGREMASRCAAWTGADISRTLLRRASRRMAHLEKVDFRHLQGAGLAGLEDAGWDRVYCHLVLLHVPPAECRQLVAGFRRVLRPDGLLYFDAWNRTHPETAALAAAEQANPSLARQPHRSRFYGRQEVERWLAAAGLQALWLSDAGFLIQVVATRDDTPAAAATALRHRLQHRGPCLVPRGHLDFCGSESITAAVDPAADKKAPAP